MSMGMERSLERRAEKHSSLWIGKGVKSCFRREK